MIARCSRASFPPWSSPFPKSATASGAWAAGRGRTTTSRWRRSSGRSSSAARSSTRRSPTATARASNCSAACSRAIATSTLVVATKIPPKNLQVAGAAEYPLDEVFPADHIRAVAPRRASQNLGVSTDRPAAVSRLDGRVGRRRPLAARGRRPQAREARPRRSASASIAGSRPTSCKALETGLVDSVQVVYNIFDQNPEDELFPMCRELGVAVIARVPFDEGSLTGTLTRDMTWPEGDWRNLYFTPREARRRRSTASTRSGRTCPPA